MRGLNKICTALVLATLLCGSFSPLAARAQVQIEGGGAGHTGGNAYTGLATCPPSYDSVKGPSPNANFNVPGPVIGCTPGNTPGQNQVTIDQAWQDYQDQQKKLADDKAALEQGALACSLGTPSSWDICLTQMVYYIGPGLANGGAFVAAYFFDIMVRLALTSTTYALDFLSQGWAIMRTIANIGFLFLLFYIAGSIMLEAETANTNRMLASFLIMALLVNFSFFLSRVVIDAGNILGTQFYNAIANTVPSGLQGADANSWLAGTTDLTAPIMQAIGVQSLLSNDQFKAWRASGDTSSLTVIIVVSFLYICIAIVFWIIAFVLLQAGIKFLLRIVNLWFVIIRAPIAFAAHVLTNSSMANRVYKNWLTDLFQYSFYPAIFLFIYYILTLIIAGMSGQGGMVTSMFSQLGAVQAGSSMTGITKVYVGIGTVMVRTGIIIALLYYGLRAADKIADEGTETAHKWSGKLTGALAGATGATGRLALGAPMRAFSKSNAAAEIRKGGTPGRLIGAGIDKMAYGSYDPRNSKTAERSVGAIGRMMGTDWGKGSKVPKKPQPKKPQQTQTAQTQAQSGQAQASAQTAQPQSAPQQSQTPTSQPTTQGQPSLAQVGASVRSILNGMQASGPTSSVGGSPQVAVAQPSSGGGPRSSEQQTTMENERKAVAEAMAKPIPTPEPQTRGDMRNDMKMDMSTIYAAINRTREKEAGAVTQPEPQSEGKASPTDATHTEAPHTEVASAESTEAVVHSIDKLREAESMTGEHLIRLSEEQVREGRHLTEQTHRLAERLAHASRPETEAFREMPGTAPVAEVAHEMNNTLLAAANEDSYNKGLLSRFFGKK